jgi:ADP-dependent NAD(P)H-hydrate dehydratase / NAD(P)H-hydrate epimerase
VIVTAPRLIDTPLHAWPLHDVASSRAIEAAAAATLPPHALMQRAGLAVARLALATAPGARRAWVAAGPGNNGGDGFEAALHLHRAGLEVCVHALGNDAARPADAAAALERARRSDVLIARGLPPDPPQADLAVDALLGQGASRAPEGELARAIELVNGSAPHRLAVDLPSGLNGDTGALLGAAAVEATETLALLTAKPGLFTAAGRDHSGRVWFDDLGVTSDAAHATALLAATPQVPQRRHRDHKGRFGDVIVIGGAPGMVGAGLLAARAAALAGGGRVLLGLLDEAAAALDAAWPELMLRPPSSLLQPEVLARSTLVCGCGGGDAVREVLPAVLSNAARLVLDADALNAVALDGALRHLLVARAARARPTVLTPHPLEAARLLGHGETARVATDRLAAARELSQTLACTVVLKGSGSVIAESGRPPQINPTGNARLATAGSGDVLAGWIGGHWSASGRDAFTAAADAVWWHGAAAAGNGPLTASMLIQRGR